MTKISLPLMLAAAAFAQEAPAPISFVRISPILNSADTNQDGTLSAAEIAGSVPGIKALDKNADGKLSRDEAGIRADQLPAQPPRGPGGRGEGPRADGRDPAEVPAPPPTADDMSSTLMLFDANNNAQLEKSEVPERFQGVFERGDTNKNGILTKEELSALATASRQMKLAPRPNRADLSMVALDTDGDFEISTAEMNAAAKSLLTLDKNGDGQITNDELTPPQGRGPGGPGRPGGPGGPGGERKQ